MAQKALIFLNSNKKEEALKYHREMVELIHASDIKLNSDFSNFKPSTIVNHTGLLVEIADEFIAKYPNDEQVLKQMAVCYEIGLNQLSESYQGEWYSKSLKDYYEIAIRGPLKMNSMGFNNISVSSVLQKMEEIENRLTWKTFL